MAFKFKIFAEMALVVLLGSFAVGQAVSGDLVGLVVDKTGAVVPNAAITVVNEATNVKASTTTNAGGEYRFSNLPIGIYDVTASATGFGAETLKGVTIDLNKANNARITLGLGEVATTVDVTDVAPAIDTTTAQVSTTYDTKQTQDLPTASVGLGVLNLSLLQAGVGSSGGVGAGTGPSVGGQRPRNNNFTIEGVDNNDKGVTGPLTYVPNDAVGNFTLLQNQFSPEFGHSTGGQFNTVILSGTNSFHGRLYEYLQNRNFNAIDVSRKNQGITKNPRYDNNRFGGQVGGPVFRNKLFFFANYEYNPIGQASTPASAVFAPTAAGFATLAGVGGLSATNLGVLKQFANAPTACTPGTSTCPAATKTCPAGNVCVTNAAGAQVPIQVGVLPIVAPNFSNSRALITSMDYNISDSDQVRGRYIYNKTAFIDTAAQLPVFYTSLPVSSHLANISEFHTFTPSVNNEFRVGFNRYGYNYAVPNFKFPGLDAFPNVAVDNLGLNIGPDGNAPQFSEQNFYQVVDNVSWIKGKHSLKFGAEGRKYISPQLFIQRARGDYEFDTLDNYLHDATPVFAERSFGSVGYSGDQIAFYSFANDVWKVLPSLTLNLGLRHEYTTVPVGQRQQSLNAVASVPGLITFAAPRANKKNFMPRVGFAWTIGSKGDTAVRGGFGMGYDVSYDNIGVLSRPPQIGATADCPDPANPSCPAVGAPFLGSGGIKPTGQTGIKVLSADAARALTSSYLPPVQQLPYSEQWNLGIQHSFLTNYTIEVRYLGSRGIHLDAQNRLNVQPRVDATHFLPTFLTAPTQAQLDALPTTLASLNARPRIIPAYSAAGFKNNIVGFLPLGASNYNGLATQLNRRFSNGLQFQAAWTWSHTIDNATADFFSTVISPRRPQDFQNVAGDRSNSVLDHAHRVTIQAIYDSPFFKGGNWFQRNILGNYEIAPIYTYQTGEWGNVQSAQDANLNGDNAADRSIVNPKGIKGTGSDTVALKNSAGATVGYLALNPTAQYIRARPGALSNGSRNTLQINPIDNIDLNILKRIGITERFKFEIAAQFLNLFNHPQFIPGSINQINSIGVTDGTTKNYLTPGKDNFNKPELTFPSNARTMQLSAKFIF